MVLGKNDVESGCTVKPRGILVSQNEMEGWIFVHNSNHWIISLAKDETTEFCTRMKFKYSDYFQNSIAM